MVLRGLVNVLYCTVQYFTTCCFSCWYTPLGEWIKPLVLGPLDKKFSSGWWHCNYSFKLQGSRGDLESLPLVELDRRHKESNSWTPSLTIFLFFSLTPAHLMPPIILNRENLFLVFSVETGVYIFSQNKESTQRVCWKFLYLPPFCAIFVKFWLTFEKIAQILLNYI